MNLVLWILPKCRQGGGGPKSRKLCRCQVWPLILEFPDSSLRRHSSLTNIKPIRVLGGPKKCTSVAGAHFLLAPIIAYWRCFTKACINTKQVSDAVSMPRIDENATPNFTWTRRKDVNVNHHCHWKLHIIWNLGL